MDDLAYLVNQVQRRDPAIMHTNARFAEDAQEPTVLIYDADDVCRLTRCGFAIDVEDDAVVVARGEVHTRCLARRLEDF